MPESDSSSVLGRDGHSVVTMRLFQIVMWVLCGIAALFLVSRFAVRMSTKGRLMMNDYFLCVALPMLFTGAGLLQSTLGILYAHEAAVSPADQEKPVQPENGAPRFTSAVETLWITIYFVKFCFLAQFKFHKPPYAYVSARLTRFYWSAISLCGTAFLFTLIQPIILCPSKRKCRYFQSTNTISWEIAVTALDIVTDLLVISIPILLIHMANFTRAHTIINAFFKSLSIFATAVAATRLALQSRTDAHHIDYVSTTLWLVVEGAVALVMASISSYRVVLLNYLAERRIQHEEIFIQPKAQPFWSATRQRWENNGPSNRQLDSQSELPIIHTTQVASSSGIIRVPA